MKISYLFILLSLICAGHMLQAQQAPTDSEELVQFSGVVVAEEYNQLITIPYVNILIQGTGRGTYTNLDGFFSIVGRKGDVVVFSAVGYETVEYTIPDTLTDNRYTIYQVLTRDNIVLPETVVYPWPSREHFKLEFLAMEVNDELQSRAEENLSEKTMEQMIEYLPSDGSEHADLYLKQQANKYVYDGQIPAQNIFNPIAWAKFIKAWKNGDFKKKKDKK